MSNLLEFPPSKIPYNARSPPYVIFAIWNENIAQQLPPQIPLNTVLHFIPKLKDWLLPAPTTRNLPQTLAWQSLRTPYIGINILSDNITAIGLKWMARQKQDRSSPSDPTTLFLTPPSLIIAVSIYRTWTALELPPAGVANLLLYMQSQLTIGSPISSYEMNLIWSFLPHDCIIVRKTGLNPLHPHRNSEYASSDTTALLHRYHVNDERRALSTSNLHYFLDMYTAQNQAAKHNAGKKRFTIAEMMEIGRGQRQTTKDTVCKKARRVKEKTETLRERSGTRSISPGEEEERYEKDGIAMQTRLRRVRSDDSMRSVETAVWSPREDEMAL
ncbi:hypothetical protein T440DRAFT_539454 [Plenodomus tracheiphilus IPT5]|uniref:Uncharacterized protein n=1 Tax=Plenodomus tracheiphilus IPT5 TaxID=1408161 RepID=A0A6A7BIE3_9PLEO|nr:hypothetical protein T440DRAFT_539454 [Plenodomus tracheiphilus IPT5]